MKEQGIGSEEYAEVFLREVFNYDGLLDVIQSDRDTRLTSAYHSSSNLPVFEFAINNADNLNTGQGPVWWIQDNILVILDIVDQACYVFKLLLRMFRPS